MPFTVDIMLATPKCKTACAAATSCSLREEPLYMQRWVNATGGVSRVCLNEQLLQPAGALYDLATL